jgi:archaellum component FlaC
MDTLDLIANSLDRVEDTTKEINKKVSEVDNKLVALQVAHNLDYKYLSEQVSAIKTDYTGNPDTGVKGFKSEFKTDFDRFKLKVTIGAW